MSYGLLRVCSVPEVSDGDLEAELAGLQDAWAEEDAAGVFTPGVLECEFCQVWRVVLAASSILCCAREYVLAC